MRSYRLACFIFTGLVNSPIVCASTDLFDIGLDQLEKIIVTAQKREQEITDVPIAISALSGDILHDLYVFDSDDLTRIYPNLSLKASNSINSGFSIRGVGTNNIHITAQQAVGFYADEISLASPYVSEFAFFDLERTEVLLGPQNTLFGRNTIGGAVNVISRKPTLNEPINGYVRTHAGNEGRLNGELAIGWPMSKTVAARLAMQSENRDGVFRDVVAGKEVGDVERHSGRLQVLWSPSDDTDVLFNAHAGYSRSDRGPRKSIGVWAAGSPNIGTPGARGVPDCPVLFSANAERFKRDNNCVTAVNAAVFNPATPSDWNDVRDIANAVANVDFEGLFVKVNHDFENVALTSITSIDQTEVQIVINSSANGVLQFFPGQEGEFEVFSQEIRLSSIDTQSYRWVGGVHYSAERDTLATIIRNASDTTPPFTLVPAVVVDQAVDVLSIYGQLEVDLNRALTLSAGLRFTRDEKTGTSTARVIAGTTTGLPGAPVAPADFVYNLSFLERVTSTGAGICPGVLPCVLAFDVRQDLEEWGGKIGLDWAYQDHSLLYFSYSRGFKSGAFDTRALAVFAGSADKPVGPEFLDAYEIGWKSGFFDGAMGVTAAAFHYQWDDLQTFALDALGTPAFLNVPRTDLSGGEVTMRWSLDTGWYLQAGVGYTDSEIIDSGGLARAREGAPVSNTPQWTYTGLIRKTHRIAAGVLELQTNFSYADETNSSNFNNPLTRIAETFFIDARVSFQFGDKQQYEIALWGENLTQEKTCLHVGEEGAITNSVTCLLNPGMAFYGLDLEVRF